MVHLESVELMEQLDHRDLKDHLEQKDFLVHKVNLALLAAKESLVQKACPVKPAFRDSEVYLANRDGQGSQVLRESLDSPVYLVKGDCKDQLDLQGNLELKGGKAYPAFPGLREEKVPQERLVSRELPG